MYTTARDGTKVPKGLKMVLEVSTARRGADWMHETLLKHSDFRDEKSMIEHLLRKEYAPCFLPKFHQLKRYTKAHYKYSLPSLCRNIPLAYDTVSLENIQNYFRKVRHYMFCYLEVTELDKACKKYKKAVKSHRKIGIN